VNTAPRPQYQRLPGDRPAQIRPNAALALIGTGAVTVVGLWWQDTTTIHGLGDWLTNAGRITGLLAAYTVVVLLALMGSARPGRPAHIQVPRHGRARAQRPALSGAPGANEHQQRTPAIVEQRTAEPVAHGRTRPDQHELTNDQDRDRRSDPDPIRHRPSQDHAAGLEDHRRRFRATHCV
jgi:hypothetical protein